MPIVKEFCDTSTYKLQTTVPTRVWDPTYWSRPQPNSWSAICIRSGSAMAGPELTQRDPESAFGVCFSMFSVLSGRYWIIENLGKNVLNIFYQITCSFFVGDSCAILSSNVDDSCESSAIESVDSSATEK